MARKGYINGGFESDPETRSAQTTNVIRRQDRRRISASYGGNSSNGFHSAEAARESIPVTLYLAGNVARNNPHRLKDVATQTDSSPTTVSSWRILRSTDNADTPCASVAHNYVVVETQALGYHTSVQTQDAHLFRYNEAQVLEMVIAWQMITLFIPTTWYLLLYVADQVSSVNVAANLCLAGEHWWCGLTITFLVLPSLVINAYAYEHHPEGIVNIATGLVSPSNVNVDRALQIGRQQLNKFESRDLDIKEVLTYELSATPPALFDDNGDMRSQNKAMLKTKLQVQVSNRHIENPDAILIDGCQPTVRAPHLMLAGRINPPPPRFFPLFSSPYKATAESRSSPQPASLGALCVFCVLLVLHEYTSFAVISP
ncbi:hypothetical protein GWK47_008271 [Chionoecetes opilio]|uniref:XK-related protein n=1 Tax=Chionoecetes opilio TaxID=41210 RepID=A0A8J4XZ85_CHIOP|nr:hypothetical protein GWK47_008271 [Chionoecetes opilio]